MNDVTNAITHSLELFIGHASELLLGVLGVLSLFLLLILSESDSRKRTK